MATPVDDSYSVGSGVTLYAGMNASGVTLVVANCTQANSVSTAAISIGGGGEPLWRQGMAVNEVKEISGSAPSVLGALAISGDTDGNWVDPWNGFSVDTRTGTVYSFANGGHTDYFGNEVNAIDLMDDAPAWTTLLAASSLSILNNLNNNSPYLSDGRPASVHSYFQQQFIEARNRAARFPTGALADSGNGSTACASFNILTNTCDAAGYLPNVPTQTYAEYGSICKISDLRTGSEAGSEDVYMFEGNSFVYRWNQATNTFTTLTLPDTWPPSELAGGPSAYDPVNNRILIWGAAANARFVFNLSDFTFDPFTATGTGVANLADKSFGLIYEPVLEKFIAKTGFGSASQKFYSIDPSTFVVTEMTVTGAGSIPAPLNVSEQNVWTKFLYVPALGGVIYFPSFTSNGWFLRTH